MREGRREGHRHGHVRLGRRRQRRLDHVLLRKRQVCEGGVPEAACRYREEGELTRGTVALAATTGVVSAAGNEPVTSRPPPSCAADDTVPPCASQTARTINSPRPDPRDPVPSQPPRRNASNRPGTSA